MWMLLNVSIFQARIFCGGVRLYNKYRVILPGMDTIKLHRCSRNHLKLNCLYFEYS